MNNVESWLKPSEKKAIAIGGTGELFLAPYQAVPRNNGKTLAIFNSFEENVTYPSPNPKSNTKVFFKDINKTGITNFTRPAAGMVRYVAQLYSSKYKTTYKRGEVDKFRYEQARSGYEIQFSVDDYLRDTNTYPSQTDLNKNSMALIDKRKNTSRNLKNALSQLRAAGVGLKSTRGEYEEMGFIQGFKIKKGIVTVQLTEKLAFFIASNALMFYPEGHMRISIADVVAQNILNKLVSHDAMNHNKPNAKIISLAKLAAAIVDLPTIEELRHSNRAINSRIVEPITKGLETLCRLENVRSYAFVGKGGNKLPSSFFERITEADFNGMYLNFELAPEIEKAHIEKETNKKTKRPKKNKK